MEPTYELAEFDENNNIKSILFTDPVQANDGETHEVRVNQKSAGRENLCGDNGKESVHAALRKRQSGSFSAG